MNKLFIFCLAFLSLGAWSHAAAKQETVVPKRLKKWNQANTSHHLLDQLLQKYVSNAKVDYLGLRKERDKLDLYLYQVAHTLVDKLRGGRNAQLAFWINAYNAITLRAVLDRIPKDSKDLRSFSVLNIKGFWKKFSYQVGGKWLSLDAIEHKVIRPQFQDARIHFVLVCAARGCPPLRNRAYRARNLSKALASATQSFLKKKRGFQLDEKQKKVRLSPLFKWYAQDFKMKPFGHELNFVAKHLLDPKQAKFLVKHQKSLLIDYTHYNWKLNAK